MYGIEDAIEAMKQCKNTKFISWDEDGDSGRTILGIFDSFEEAYMKAQKHIFDIDDFQIDLCEENMENGIYIKHKSIDDCDCVFNLYIMVLENTEYRKISNQIFERNKAIEAERIK